MALFPGLALFLTVSAYNLARRRAAPSDNREGRAPMTERIALYPGSFDPLTNGHLDIRLARRRLADQVVVGDPRERREDPALLGRRADRDDPRDRRRRRPTPVRSFSGLLVDFAQRVGRDADRARAARGLRLRVRAADGADEPPPGARPSRRSSSWPRRSTPTSRAAWSRKWRGWAATCRGLVPSRCAGVSPRLDNGLVRSRCRDQSRLRVRVVAPYAETDRMGIVYHAPLHRLVRDREDRLLPGGGRAVPRAGGLGALDPGDGRRVHGTAGSARYDDAVRVRSTLAGARLARPRLRLRDRRRGGPAPGRRARPGTSSPTSQGRPRRAPPEILETPGAFRTYAVAAWGFDRRTVSRDRPEDLPSRAERSGDRSRDLGDAHAAAVGDAAPRRSAGPARTALTCISQVQPKSRSRISEPPAAHPTGWRGTGPCRCSGVRRERGSGSRRGGCRSAPAAGAPPARPPERPRADHEIRAAARSPRGGAGISSGWSE